MAGLPLIGVVLKRAAADQRFTRRLGSDSDVRGRVGSAGGGRRGGVAARAAAEYIKSI